MDHGSEFSIPTSSSRGKRIWKSQTGERAPFWCTALIFTRANDQCFVPHMIFHQAENYTQDIHWNLPSDWLVHNTSPVYMDRDVWMKAISLFSRTCGYSKLNPQVLFFDVHDSHFNDRVTHLLRSHHVSPFILKAGDSKNDQPNDNGPNLKLKINYSLAKVKWQRQHGTMIFTASHMNYVLVEMWHLFQQQSYSVKNDEKKTKLPPLAPPDHNTNAQAYLAATQMPPGTKS